MADSLTAQGWTQSPHYGADGPDGTMLGLQKDGLYCLMNGWSRRALQRLY
jgi:hypothetical protein